MRTSEHLKLGGLYTRKQLQEMFDIKDASIRNGIFRPKGHSSVWIFLTSEKRADRIQYIDRIDGDFVYFDGQLKSTTDRLIICSKDVGNELLLFHRQSVYDYGQRLGGAFRYYGPIEYISHEGSGPTHFKARFTTRASLEIRDIDAFEAETYIEGGARPRHVNIYERDPELRWAAIKVHGTICQVCGFDFEYFYGERGRGYIEVHHLKPVSTLKGPQTVDPEKDMAVLCANCHRMVHRRKDDILTPEQLRSVVRRTKARID